MSEIVSDGTTLGSGAGRAARATGGTILLEAALASGQPEEVRPVLEMMERIRLQDLPLLRLANQLEAKR